MWAQVVGGAGMEHNSDTHSFLVSTIRHGSVGPPGV
jgi:hypothetical protein